MSPMCCPSYQGRPCVLSSPPLPTAFPAQPNEARIPGAGHGLTQASESSCFIGSYSDIIFQTALQSWDQGWDQGWRSSCDDGRRGYVSPHTRGSVAGVPAGGRCGPNGIGLGGPRPSTTGESQGIAAHGSPEGQPAASTARGTDHS